MIDGLDTGFLVAAEVREQAADADVRVRVRPCILRPNISFFRPVFPLEDDQSDFTIANPPYRMKYIKNIKYVVLFESSVQQDCSAYFGKSPQHWHRSWTGFRGDIASSSNSKKREARKHVIMSDVISSMSATSVSARRSSGFSLWGKFANQIVLPRWSFWVFGGYEMSQIVPTLVRIDQGKLWANMSFT